MTGKAGFLRASFTAAGFIASSAGVSALDLRAIRLMGFDLTVCAIYPLDNGVLLPDCSRRATVSGQFLIDRFHHLEQIRRHEADKEKLVSDRDIFAFTA